MDLIAMKKNLSVEELNIVNIELDRKKKSKTVMWILWLFLGGIGGHRYYLGDIIYAIGMTLTLGGLGIWTLIDAFMIGKRLDMKNEYIEAEIIYLLKPM